jgi:hypothetical protein
LGAGKRRLNSIQGCFINFIVNLGAPAELHKIISEEKGCFTAKIKRKRERVKRRLEGYSALTSSFGERLFKKHLTWPNNALLIKSIQTLRRQKPAKQGVLIII